LHERDSAKKPLVITSVECHEGPFHAWRLVGKRDDARSSHDPSSYTNSAKAAGDEQPGGFSLSRALLKSISLIYF
jgi:hypothetical protein